MPKVRGLDVYLKVNTGTVGSPVWTKVGGQRGATITPGLSDIDVTDKDNEGWMDNLAGLRSFDVEFDAFLIEDDAGFLEVKKGFWERKDLHCQIITPAKTYTGLFRLTEMPMEAPHDDAASVSFTLKNIGPIVET